MADNKSKRGGADRAGLPVAMATKSTTSPAARDQQAPSSKLIDRVGNDREKLNAAAGKQAKVYLTLANSSKQRNGRAV